MSISGRTPFVVALHISPSSLPVFHLVALVCRKTCYFALVLLDLAPASVQNTQENFVLHTRMPPFFLNIDSCGHSTQSTVCELKILWVQGHIFARVLCVADMHASHIVGEIRDLDNKDTQRQADKQTNSNRYRPLGMYSD